MPTAAPRPTASPRRDHQAQPDEDGYSYIEKSEQCFNLFKDCHWTKAVRAKKLVGIRGSLFNDMLLRMAQDERFEGMMQFRAYRGGRNRIFMFRIRAAERDNPDED